MTDIDDPVQQNLFIDPKEPPLGIAPRHIWEAQVYDDRAEERKADIVNALRRYLDHGNATIPPEWLEEYNYIIVKGFMKEPSE